MNWIRATFKSLSIRNFRVFFIGQSISQVGNWMQKTAQAWLVLEMTGSGTLLGVTAALQHLPILLLGSWAGVLADRLGKRAILIWAQGTAAILACGLGTLIAVDRLEIWMIMLFALLLGCTDALDKPARMTFVVEMVNESDILNALTLNQVIINVGKVIGPAVAGLAIAALGTAATFMIDSVSYVVAVLSLFLIRVNDLSLTALIKRESGQIVESLKYVRNTPVLFGPLVLLTLSGMLAYEWSVSLPLLATDAFARGAQGFSMLFSSMGIGAILGGFIVAGSVKSSLATLIISGAVLSTTMVATAASPTFGVAAILVALVGASSVAFKMVGSSLVQLESAPQMRGRVAALLAMAAGGTTTVGGPVVGWLGETIGARVALAQGGIVTGVASLWCYLYLRKATEKRTSWMTP